MQVHAVCLAVPGTVLHRIWPVNMSVQPSDKDTNYTCSAQILLVHILALCCVFHIFFDNALLTVYEHASNGTMNCDVYGSK
jgi:hypothetical protein